MVVPFAFSVLPKKTSSSSHMYICTSVQLCIASSTDVRRRTWPVSTVSRASGARTPPPSSPPCALRAVHGAVNETNPCSVQPLCAPPHPRTQRKSTKSGDCDTHQLPRDDLPLTLTLLLLDLARGGSPTARRPLPFRTALCTSSVARRLCHTLVQPRREDIQISRACRCWVTRSLSSRSRMQFGDRG